MTGTGFTLIDGATMPGGGSVFLSIVPSAAPGQYGFLFGAGNDEVPVRLKGCEGPSSASHAALTPWWLSWLFSAAGPIDTKPHVWRLAVGSDGTIWMGGSTNYYMNFASAEVRDAYVAKLDQTGKVLLETAFGRTLYAPKVLALGVRRAGAAKLEKSPSAN
jgi:hypothetical protein